MRIMFCTGKPLAKKMRSTEDEAVVLFDRESKEAFQAFLHDPQVRETMKASGATPAPEFTYLDQVAKFPG